jgi:predicted branched-subunit amino acid permease
MTSFSKDFKSGIADAWPMFLAYAPIAALWGTLAAAKGFSPLEAMLMSFFVYAGASQFVAIEMWGFMRHRSLATWAVFPSAGMLRLCMF